MILRTKVGIKAFFKFFSVNPETGKETELSDWCGNTLLTSGRNQLASRAWFTYCQIGTSETPATAGQTALLGFIASTNIQPVAAISGAEGSAPFYGWKRKRFRFDPDSGIANENLNEVAIGWSATEGDITNRALIVDITGNQVTITPLAGEILDVLVEVRYYPPLEQTTGTVVFDGVTYDYIITAAAVTSVPAWGDNIGSQIISYSNDVSHWSAYDQDIGTIEQYPDGVSTDSEHTADYTNTYVQNSYQIDFGMGSGPNGWNVLTNKLLRSLQILTTAGHYQVQFDSQVNPGFGIPKTDQKVINFQFTLGWEEAGPVFTGTIPDQNWTEVVLITPVDTSTYFGGSPEPNEYTISSGSLPTGVTLAPATGLITGTPTTASSGTCTIKCTNEVGFASSNPFNWTVT